MRAAITLFTLILSAGGMATAAAAQSPTGAAGCAEQGVLWQNAIAHEAARDIAHSPTLAMGEPVHLRLYPEAQVRFASRPDSEGDAAAFGGLADFTVERAGTYGVALGQAAWVDVVRDGRAAESVAHGHGAECSGIAKQVSFELQPGRYTLELSRSGDADLGVVIRPMP